MDQQQYFHARLHAVEGWQRTVSVFLDYTPILPTADYRADSSDEHRLQTAIDEGCHDSIDALYRCAGYELVGGIIG